MEQYREEYRETGRNTEEEIQLGRVEGEVQEGVLRKE